MSDKSGKIVRVLTGVRAGMYGHAIEKKQEQIFLEKRKLYIRLYQDQECEVPLNDEDGKQLGCLVGFDNIEHIGFID